MNSELRILNSGIQSSPALGHRTLCLLPLLLSCIIASLHGAGGYFHSVPMEPGSRDSILVTSFMDNTPTAGFMPLRVTIDNRSQNDRIWRLEPVLNQGDWMQAQWTFAVKAGTRAEFDLYVPLKTANFNYRWGAQFSWSGPGVDSGMMQLPQTSGSSSMGSQPFVGISDALHSKHWGGIQSSLPDVSGSALHLAQAPADWRAWIALDQIWMTASEWKALEKDKKQAVLEAAALGNELVLVCSSSEEAQSLGETFGQKGDEKAKEWPFGAGRVRLMVGGDTGNSMADLIRKSGQKSSLLEYFHLSNWLDQQIPEVETAGPLVLLFIVLFGIVAGPVNLFVLAPAGRRHRLFITTPLISIGGSLALAAAIFIQDGTGGSGTRLIHAQVLPEAKRLLVTQEQVSRCGLLFGTSFKTADPVWMQPLPGDAVRDAMTSSLRYRIAADGSFSGDWFRNRSRQHHFLQSARPSRAAIEFTPGDEPSIISTFEATLDEIYVRDPEGAVWRAKNVQPGTRLSLTREPGGMHWWNDHVREFGLAGLLAQSVQASATQPSGFFARMQNPGNLPIETLPSIRWQTPLVLVSGPLTLKP